MRSLLTIAGMVLCMGAVAQSQRQLADRGVDSTVVRTVDERKGARSVRVVRTTYDHKGNVLEAIERDGNGRIVEWVRRTYDRKGRDLTSSQLDSAGVEIERIERSWDRWGNEVGSTTTERGLVTERTVATFDKYGDRQQELVSDAGGKQIRRITFEYESRGLVERRVVYDGNDRVVYERTWTYAY